MSFTAVMADYLTVYARDELLELLRKLENEDSHSIAIK